MTSHETRSTFTTRNKSAASDQNDLKKLKSKYSAKLPTLKVLFSDWSDDDLLFVLEEANGDLDITIDRISEGHASQWGEVKTKKSKKEAQKAKAATATVNTNQQQSTITPYRETTTKPTPSRSYNDRAPRAGKASTQRTRTPKSSSIQTVSWDSQPKSTSSHEVSSGSWASIAKQHSDSVGNDDGWNTTTATNDITSTSDEWGPTASSNNAPSSSNNDTNDEDQPKTWASLLKSKPKNEPEQTTTNEEENDDTVANEWNAPTSNVNSSTDPWDAPADVNISSGGWDAPNEPIADEWSTPVHESAPVDTKEEEKKQESPLEEVKAELEKESSPANEEPVVSPNNASAISTLDAKFDSLAVNEDSAVEETIKETTIVTETTPEEPIVQTTTTTSSTVPSTTTTTTPAANESFNQPSTYLKQQQQEPAYSQPATIPQQQQQVPQQLHQAPHQQQQIPQQQQQLGMDHLTSAYSSYLPNQPPTGVSGFGMNPMGNLPDYGIYSTEAQRAAAMGYYDPTAFSHSPSVTSASVYQSRDKYSQDVLHGQAGQNANIPQQQMYPTNLPYYQYYYMPNQYSAYQQSAYGQPFMNKSMYPSMYQQQQQQQQQQQPNKPTATGNAAAASSPYGNVSSPYGQQSQLYNHQYDDLSMGLNDYQKSMYGSQPQYQGFLGQLGGNQQQSQAQQTQQAPSQQHNNKQPDLARSNSTNNGAAANTNAAVQQQQQQHTPQQQTQQVPLQQQQLPQQQTYGNYFGQPQMFSYGQYPQYQQLPHQQSQQQQRQQQQYWNQ